MGMKTPTGNPVEIYLAFATGKPWDVIESDTAPFIAPEKNPEWYIKQSEYDAAQASIATLTAMNKKLREDVEKHREAAKAAYMGILALKAMCGKKGLVGGVKATESAVRQLIAVMPELQALSALRGSVVSVEEKP